jgi:hypothetical protein
MYKEHGSPLSFLFFFILFSNHRDVATQRASADVHSNRYPRLHYFAPQVKVFNLSNFNFSRHSNVVSFASRWSVAMVIVAMVIMVGDVEDQSGEVAVRDATSHTHLKQEGSRRAHRRDVDDFRWACMKTKEGVTFVMKCVLPYVVPGVMMACVMTGV